MPDITFDLRIDHSPAGYAVRAAAPTTIGEIRAQSLELPFDLTGLPGRRRDAAEWVKQARVRRLRGSEELQQARAFGTELFDRLFAGEILAGLRTCRSRLGPGERLRLQLRLPPELAGLPWELLYDPMADAFLALDQDVSLVRYPELSSPLARLRVDGPLQVVVVLASPNDRDYGRINVDRELRRIEDALRAPIAQGRIALDVIRGPRTRHQLRSRLRDPANHPAHIVHILCHGDLDQKQDEGLLIFEDDDGAAEPVNAELLRQYIQSQSGKIRLVLLNACLGAISAGEDPSSGVGAALLRGGVPAVIAMQFELAEDAAAELARVFYAELVAGAPVDLALAAARREIYGKYHTQLDWAVPVLFMRSEDGVLFVLDDDGRRTTDDGRTTAPSLPALAAGDLRLKRARARIQTGKWDAALKLYEELVTQFTLPPEHQANHERARTEVWRAQTSTAIDAAEAQRNWVQLIALLEQYTHHDAQNQPMLERLERACAEHELDELAHMVADLAQDNDWETVGDLIAQIRQRRPEYMHPTIDLPTLELQCIAVQALQRASDQAEQHDWLGVMKTISAVPKAALDDDLRALLTYARVRVAVRHAARQAQAQDWDGVIMTLTATKPAAPDSEHQRLLDLAHAAKRAEAQARREAEERARKQAEEQTRKQAEEQARKQAEEQARQKAAEQARREAEERARKAAEQQARQAATARAPTQADAPVSGQATKALDALETLLKQQPYDRNANLQMAALIEDRRVPLEQRLRAARLAGQYDDPRPGVCTLVPNWCGPFLAGEYPIADGQVRVRLGEFQVARYPVTVWQYRQFVDAQGYADKQWWTPQGWEWRKSGTRPDLWEDPKWIAANHPVIGVAWYEAIAFCRWLTVHGRSAGWVPPDREIRLPSEAEWEVAAMWDAARKKMREWQPPVGELWQNVKEAGIGRTAPVGLFPQGASPCGALDMAGNVWEWCSSAYLDYPQQAGPGRSGVDFPGGLLRASSEKNPTVRGGGYYLQNERSGWGARVGSLPDNLNGDFGFRVIVCAAPRA